MSDVYDREGLAASLPKRTAALPHAGRASGPASSAELALLILENSVEGVMAHTLDGRLVYFNDKTAQDLGYSRQELAALEPYGWVDDENMALVPSRLAVIRERGSLLFSSRAVRKDGSVINTEVHTHLVDFEGQELVVSVIRDVTEQVLAHERIRHLAFHDRLTGLANRMKLEDDLRGALAFADRHADLVGVIFLDLDDFKPVNDELGHAAGDEVLCEVARRIHQCVREGDTVARLGGDEFVVVIARMAAREDLASVARKIEDRIEEPIAVAGCSVRVTTSAGLATYDPGEAAEDLINRADHAMYRAKQAGESGWEAYLKEA